MAFQVDRSPFDPESGFEYYICFKPESQVEGDEVQSRISVEIGVSVSETGDMADLSFMLPKACRNDSRCPSSSAIRRRPAWRTGCLFHARPERRCGAQAPGTLELDNAGRIVAVEINGCIPQTSTFRPASA